jgi:hypothetical protein
LRVMAPSVVTTDPRRRSFVTQPRLDLHSLNVRCGAHRRWGDVSQPNSAGAALRPADESGVRSVPSGPDAARLNPYDVFEHCWRRQRG